VGNEGRDVMRVKAVKATALVILFSVMLTTVTALAGGSIIWWQPEKATFYGYGSYVCGREGETPPSTWGDRCSFWVKGGKIGGVWTGNGLWVNLDWDGGVLTAILKITGGGLGHDPLPGHITEIFQLQGEARVFIGRTYKGTYTFSMGLFDADAGINLDEWGKPCGPQSDLIGFTLWGIEGCQTGNEMLRRGDIVCWWYPEFSGE
jgi:hypothetical protein